MTIDSNTKPAPEYVSFLYCLVGEAICMIQNLEGSLSVSITLKKDVQYPHRISKNEANNFLKKQRSLTLGQAIKLAKNNNLYSDTLYNDLLLFLEERNWLVHRFFHEQIDDIYDLKKRDMLFHKIKAISNKARSLQEIIDNDLIDYSECVGVDMSRVRLYIKLYSQTLLKNL